MQRLGIVLVLALASGCAWFKELQSAESVDGTGTGDDTEAGTEDESGDDDTASTGDGACEIAEDDRCADQDTLHSCDPATGELTEYACADLCSGTMNFSCVIASADARHGCWCVVAGDQKLLTCTELEGCLLDCTDDSTSACADACFAKTNAGTIRTYGALVSCAHHECDDTCREEPASCAGCISTAIASGMGDCTLERSVCDADAAGDPWWPE
jgi:hypothetical protein